MSVRYIVQDSKSHDGYQYLVCYRVRGYQVGHRADAIKYCSFIKESEAIDFASDLKKSLNRDFYVEECAFP
jgi:hypothetical protein